MINALFIQADEQKPKNLESILREECPEIQIKAHIEDMNLAQKMLEKCQPSLIFLDISYLDEIAAHFLQQIVAQEIEFIIITRLKELIFQIARFTPTAFVLKPLNQEDLVLAVEKARRRIDLKIAFDHNQQLMKELNQKLLKDDLMGIPTLEGFDFIQIKDILYCKGYERCTQIITVDKTNIVSSYNLGEFQKLLEPFNFLLIHRTYLINMNRMKKYKRDGHVVMCNGDIIMVSQRKKAEFISRIRRIS